MRQIYFSFFHSSSLCVVGNSIARLDETILENHSTTASLFPIKKPVSVIDFVLVFFRLELVFSQCCRLLKIKRLKPIWQKHWKAKVLEAVF